jgi:predicted RNase H-like HicB family nuclease
MHDNYPIVVFWSDEDGEFIADIPDLRYCSAGGETPEEAVREVMIARAAWLASAREHGETLPDPRHSRFWPDIALTRLADPPAVVHGTDSAAAAEEAGAA